MGAPLRVVLRAMALAGVLTLAAPAGFASDFHDFAGKVAGISEAAVRVESRMGDVRSFARRPDTKVSGARKAWGRIEPGDRVVVSWSFSDERAEARRVRVVSRGGD